MPRTKGSKNKPKDKGKSQPTSEARRGRKRKQSDVDHISSAWYVGYAEDEESVEAIMKKFEELEQLQKEVLEQQQESQPVASSSTSVPAESFECIPDSCSQPSALETPPDTQEINDQPGLTQQQLEELFRRTSAFTVKSVALDVDVYHMNDLEWWNFENGRGLDDDWEEEDDYQIMDDEVWERMMKGPAKPCNPTVGPDGLPVVKVERRGRPRKYPKVIKEKKSSRIKPSDREALLAKYKVLQVQMQDRNGDYFLMKRRVAVADPDVPTYVRIPSAPIPRSWVRNIMPLRSQPEKPIGTRVIKTDILSYPLHTLGNKFQAVYLDAPFLLPGEAPSPGKISVEQFGQMDIPSVIQYGFLFIWAEKELTPSVIEVADKWGFRYVENFAWIKKDLKNQIARQPSRYFNKSKTTCFIFRKEGDTELRHQRNPDCEFDFVKPRRPGQLTEEKPPLIYEVIETLLPSANYSESFRNGEGLLELWGTKPQGRKGWTTLVQSPSSS